MAPHHIPGATGAIYELTPIAATANPTDMHPITTCKAPKVLEVLGEYGISFSCNKEPTIDGAPIY